MERMHFGICLSSSEIASIRRHRWHCRCGSRISSFTRWSRSQCTSFQSKTSSETRLHPDSTRSSSSAFAAVSENSRPRWLYARQSQTHRQATITIGGFCFGRSEGIDEETDWDTTCGHKAKDSLYHRWLVREKHRKRKSSKMFFEGREKGPVRQTLELFHSHHWGNFSETAGAHVVYRERVGTLHFFLFFFKLNWIWTVF